MNLKTIQDLIAIASGLVDLFTKAKEAKKKIECDHTYNLTHNEALGFVHIDETFCGCKPRYVCFMCGKIPPAQAHR